MILPPMPAFYSGPQTIDDIVNHTVARMLDRLRQRGHRRNGARTIALTARAHPITRAPLPAGNRVVVDAHGCDPERWLTGSAGGRLRTRGRRAGPAPRRANHWRVFPGGGVTGLLLLTESHLACHTYPEHAFAAFDLYCCRPGGSGPGPERLRDALGARGRRSWEAGGEGLR